MTLTWPAASICGKAGIWVNQSGSVLVLGVGGGSVAGDRRSGAGAEHFTQGSVRLSESGTRRMKPGGLRSQ